MHGILFIVGTPIGNLEDITLRALRVLRQVDAIAAEDTRRTRHLLEHHGIRTPTLSLHEHNERVRTRQLLDRLAGGASIAVVSDAGMPGISDPGAYLVREARAAGVRVEVIPGPSAVTAALTGSGVEAGLATFAGFPPARGPKRREWFERVGRLAGAVVFFEAPHRVARTLEQALQAWGDRRVTLARELTKVHESFVTRPISELIRSEFRPRGEYTLVLWPAAENSQGVKEKTDEEIADKFWQLTKIKGLDRREALKIVAMELGLARKRVFDAVERHKIGLITKNTDC